MSRILRKESVFLTPGAHLARTRKFGLALKADSFPEEFGPYADDEKLAVARKIILTQGTRSW